MEVIFWLKTGGIRGVVVKLDYKQIEFLTDTTINLGAGVLLSKISNIAYERALSGLEFACRNSWNNCRSNKNECRCIW